MIGFAGARVLKETTRQDLPKGFQTAEFLLERGLIDRIVSRLDLRAEIAKVLVYLGTSTTARKAQGGHGKKQSHRQQEPKSVSHQNGHSHEHEQAA